MTTIKKVVSTSSLITIGSSVVAILAAFVAGPTLVGAATLNRQLEIGMTGSDVSVLQTYLANDRSVYPEGLVTGYFGLLTKSAVSVFQTHNGISSVGRVGPITLVAINSKLTDSTVGSDRTAPIIRSINIDSSDSEATITWDTNIGAAAIVYYDTKPITMTEAGPFTDITVSGKVALAEVMLRTAHEVVLPNLDSDTKYYYVLYVRDASGNVSITWPSDFTTDN